MPGVQAARLSVGPPLGEGNKTGQTEGNMALKSHEKVENLLDKIADVKALPMVPAALRELLDALGEIVRDQQRDIARLDRTLGNI